jgi:GNAT superfamily N-acetyltransferase
MRTNLEIRAVTEAELAAVVELLVTQLREHHNELPEEALARAAAGLWRRPQRGQLLIALEAGTVVGFAALSYLWTLERGGSNAWLDELYVVPTRRGYGIGTALLRSAIDVARQIGALAVELEIDADHARAVSLYQRAGFTSLPRTRWALALPPRSPAQRQPCAALDGGCYCRAVRYRITAPVLVVAHCHCSICRRATGAPLVTWATVASESFHLASGTPAELHSTSSARRTFCAACGTALTFQSRDRSDLVDITVGSLDDPNALPPEHHIWTSSRIAWLHLDDDLPHHLGAGPTGP